MTAQMTPAELKAAFTALQDEISSKCGLYPSVAMGDPRGLVSCSIYPNGICGKVHLQANADTWEGLIEAVRERWASHSDLHADNTVKAMALAIIRITAERGDCTDAALRGDGFDARDVIRFGERAVWMADEMAGNGPFSIVRTPAANDAEAA